MPRTGRRSDRTVRSDRRSMDPQSIHECRPNILQLHRDLPETGAYYRYAFTSGENFPDYPKYGVWTNMYVLTTREFGPAPGNKYGIGVYALEKNKLLNGEPNARAIKFFLDSDVVPITQIGDGLLPADIDGNRRPRADAPAPVIGTMDDGGPYGA